LKKGNRTRFCIKFFEKNGKSAKIEKANIMNKYPHAGLTFKAIDWIDLTPSGLVRLGSAYVNRFHRMLFMLIPLRGFMKGIKGSHIAQGIFLRYKPGICEWQLSCLEIPEGFNVNNIRRSLVKGKVFPRIKH
jgi:hypothetical protein